MKNMVFCGGSFPIFIKGVPARAITVTGLRPREVSPSHCKLEKLFLISHSLVSIMIFLRIKNKMDIVFDN